jgi:hypothetical protein
MSRSQRLVLGVLFALALALCAFVPGMWVGGQTVDEHAGLAGGAIVFMTGLLISAAALVVGAILAYVLSARLLQALTIIAGIPAVLVVIFIGHGYLNYARERDAFHDDQIANLPPITLSLSQTEAVAGRAFAEIEYDTAQMRYIVTSTNGALCTEDLPAQSRDKVRLLTALRNVEILLARQPAPCADGVVLHRAHFRIREAQPPDTAGTVDMTSVCLEEHPELRALVTVAKAVFEANGCR